MIVDARCEINALFSICFIPFTNRIIFPHFRHVVAKLGLKMTDDQITDMIKIADKDGDGDVNYLEFVRLMKK